MAFAVQMTIVKGDCGGMLLRFNSSTGQGYYLAVCQDRSYQFIKLVNFTGESARTLIRGSSSAIHGGRGQSNLVAVVARGSMFDLYVNGQKINSARDDSYTEGVISLFADDVSNATEVVYSTARVWTVQ